jgi:hypothetical protein
MFIYAHFSKFGSLLLAEPVRGNIQQTQPDRFI